MTRLTLLAFASTLAVVFLDIAVIAIDVQDHDDKADSSERSGAYASAQANVNVVGRPGIGFPPGPGFGGFLDCYVCTDCPKVLANTTSKVCPRGLDVSKQNTCIIYAEKFSHMKKRWVTRGCASERGSCADIRRSREAHKEVVALEFCVECEGSKCNNKNGASQADFAIAALLLAFTPLIAKYTL